ncbi:hypothetical protein CR513_34910, partial [Mucuna pruriens]
MPKICKCECGAPKAAALHHLALDISQMGRGHLGTILTRPRSIDYFTKWIEVEPIATILAERIKRFYWKKIICRFGLLVKIVSNNETKFASRITASFCAQLKIKQWYTSVEHPSRTDKPRPPTKLSGEREVGRKTPPGPLVVPHDPHSSTNETPFHLTFVTEAIISVEIGESSPRTALFQLAENEDKLRVNMDLL